jgi:hypothetical protein
MSSKSKTLPCVRTFFACKQLTVFLLQRAADAALEQNNRIKEKLSAFSAKIERLSELYQGKSECTDSDEMTFCLLTRTSG